MKTNTYTKTLTAPMRRICRRPSADQSGANQPKDDGDQPHPSTKKIPPHVSGPARHETAAPREETQSFLWPGRAVSVLPGRWGNVPDFW